MSPPPGNGSFRPANSAWSPDGHWVTIGDAVVEIATKRSVPLDCAKGRSLWGPGSRVACLRATGSFLLDVSSSPAAPHALACTGDSGGWLDAGHLFCDVSTDTVILDLTSERQVTIGPSGTLVALRSNHTAVASVPGSTRRYWAFDTLTPVGPPMAVIAAGVIEATSPDLRFDLLVSKEKATLVDTLHGSVTMVAGASDLRDGMGIAVGETDPTSFAPFSPDAREVVIPRKRGGASVIRLPAGTERTRLHTSECDAISDAGWSSDGRLIALGTERREVCIFDAKTARIVSRWPLVNRPRSSPGQNGVSVPLGTTSFLVFTPDGRGLVAGENAWEPAAIFAALYDTHTGKELGDLGYIHRVRITPRGDLVALGPEAPKIVDSNLRVQSLGTDTGLASLVSRDGHWATSQNEAGVITRVLGSAGESVELEGGDTAIESVFDPTSTKLLGTHEGRACVWEVATGRIVFEAALKATAGHDR